MKDYENLSSMDQLIYKPILAAPVAARKTWIVSLLRLLPDGERMDIFGEFCRYCGDDRPDCQCWNDD